jgi:2-polyprenyl-6-methoxyphenol hydroxylase-like FAD-dependent oxidoreductase
MATAAATAETQILIVGSGPVGLAAAIELGHRGIQCIVVEQHERVGHTCQTHGKCRLASCFIAWRRV